MPEDDEYLRPVFLEPIPGSFAAETQRMSEAIRLLGEQIAQSLGIPFSVAVQHLATAMRSDLPEERLRFNNPYFTGPNLRQIVERQRTVEEIIEDPAATQENSYNPDIFRRLVPPLPPMRHDVRPVTGECPCGEPAIAQCFSISCIHQGILMCAKHLTEQHDGHTYPEGVPHG